MFDLKISYLVKHSSVCLVRTPLRSLIWMEKSKRPTKVLALLIDFANMYQENLCLQYINPTSDRI